MTTIFVTDIDDRLVSTIASAADPVWDTRPQNRGSLRIDGPFEVEMTDDVETRDCRIVVVHGGAMLLTLALDVVQARLSAGDKVTWSHIAASAVRA